MTTTTHTTTTQIVAGRVHGWNVTHDGVDVILRLAVDTPHGERTVALRFEPADASDCGYRLDQETGQIDATCSAIDDRDEAQLADMLGDA